MGMVAAVVNISCQERMKKFLKTTVGARAREAAASLMCQKKGEGVTAVSVHLTLATLPPS
jgi:hypothetical protein